MAVELATAYVSLVASARGISQSIAEELGSPVEKAAGTSGDKAASQFGTKFKSGLKNAAAGVGVAFGAAAIVQGVAGLKNAASDLNETISKSNTIFGSSAGAIEAWANGAANSIGQSKQQALDAAASFGNMFQQLGIGQEQAAGMSTQMVGLASDFASFHNADITQVLEAQAAAFRGEYDAVQRFVPTINAAAVEQKAMEMGLAATTSELDAQDKALATQALLWEGAGAARGDFARTSGSLANKERILSANLDNLKAQIGTALIPIFSAVTTVLLTAVIPAITQGGDVVSTMLTPVRLAAEHWDTLKYVVGVAAAIMVPHFVAIATQATIAGARQVAAWVAAQASTVAASVTHSLHVAQMVAHWVLLGVQSLLHAAKVAAAWLIAMGPIGIVAAAVIALVALIVLNWDKIKAVIAAGWDFVKRVTSETWETLKRLTSAAVDAVVGFFSGLPGRVVGAVTSKLADLVNLGSWVIGRILDGINAARDLLDWFSGLPGKAFDLVMEGARRLVDLGKDIVGKIVEGIREVAGDIGSAILGAIPGGNAIGSVIGKINPWGDGEGFESQGPPGQIRVTGRTAGAPSNTWARLLSMVAATGVSATASSVYRPGSITRSGNRSYHGMGRAVDLVGNLTAIQRALQRYGPLVKEIIGPNPALNWRNGRPHRYNAAVQGDHYDHVHFAMHSGGIVAGSAGARSWLEHDERLRVLEVGEVVLPRGATAGNTYNIFPREDSVASLVHEMQIAELQYGGGIR